MLKIEVWAVSNLTFVLLNFIILHSTTDVPFKIVVTPLCAILKSKTCQQRHHSSAACRLRKDVSEVLQSITNTLQHNEIIVGNAMNQKLHSLSIICCP